MNNRKINVMIIDDSKTATTALEFLFSKDDALHVVGSFEDPVAALDYLDTVTPDILIVDIVMPKMNGFEFIETMKKKYNLPAIVVSSIYTPEDKYKTMKAFEVGALAILEKPIGKKEKDIKLGEELIKTIKDIANERRSTPPPTAVKYAPKEQKYKLIGIGSSLGGPNALQKLLETLPQNFMTPIVIVQHIGEGYDVGLVKWLSRVSYNTVKLAEDNAEILPGKIYIAPYNNHITVTKENKFKFTNDPPINLLRPAVDVFFKSLASTFGKECIAILLTGMGHDGVEGMEALFKAGAYTIAQHERGCEMYGMPRSAIEANITKAVIPIDQLGEELGKLVI
jgi:two-component system, chemotaxis family, protein-glutamate methylesterase/glutaminase